MTDGPGENNPLQRRRLTSFSLRTALVAITVFGVWLGLHIRSVKKQQASVEAVQRFGGWAYYDYEIGGDFKIDPNPESPVPAWLLKTLGRDHFHDIVYVNMVFDEKGGKRRDKTNRSGEVLRHLDGFPNLESLWLCETQATDENLRHVGRLTSLRRLLMGNAPEVSDSGVEHLSELNRLEFLHLTNSGVTDASLLVLARLPKLHTLSLQLNGFTDRGLEYVQQMPQLRKLAVGHGDGKITDAGLVHLAQLEGLEVLDLQKTEITDQGLRHLVGLRNLKELWMGESEVKDASWLKQQLPNCMISP